MKILHVLADFQLGGGYLPAILPLCKYLIKLGHTVEVVAVNSEGGNFDIIKTFPLKGLPAWSRSPTLDDWLGSNVKDFDVVHIHGLWSYPQFRASQHAINNKVPYVVSPHGIFIEPMRYSGLKKKLYWNLIGRGVVGSAQAIHVTSDLELDGCKIAGIQNALVMIPWGVDISNHLEKSGGESARRMWPTLANKRILLYLSRISPEKGLDQLLLAISSLRDMHENFILVIAGQDDEKYRYKEVLDALIKKNGLQGHVFFTGLVQGQAKYALLAEADIFVMPSYGENFSFSIAEALSCGVPVITTTKTPWRSIQEVSAGCCVAPNVDALCGALNQLLSLSSKELIEMGERGRGLINDKYDWTLISKRFENFYKSICDKNISIDGY